jgi:uncharacterized protein (DUF1800 family)
MNPIEEYWPPYAPSPQAPWNRRRVVHLHRRASWGATWREIERDLAEGPAAALDRLLSPILDGKLDSAVRRAEDLASQAIAKQQAELLQAAWITRLWHGPDPLGEQLTLMWHNHFATSNLKVRDVAMMNRHVATLRTHARGPFEKLLRLVVVDPAMLVWLDADQNRREHPNENLARELMELFTLGEGHYRETDIREAARALTGWKLEDGQAHFDAADHDDGEKEILGRRGRWNTDDLVQLLIEHSATSKRLAWRICDHFLAGAMVPADALEALAGHLRQNGLDIGAAVATVLRSSRFFDEAELAHRVSPPASYIVASIRSLELHEAGCSPQVAAAWMRSMGQDLLHPPGVGGWPGGRASLGATAMINRARFARMLGEGTLYPGAPRVDLDVLSERNGFRESAIEFTSLLLFGESAEAVSSENTLPALLTSPRAQFD